MRQPAMIRHAFSSLFLLLVLTTPCVHAQTNAGATDAVADIERRAAQLREDDPESYFLLAEEAADLGLDEFAERLFVLAASLDPESLGRSACLALAAIAEDEGHSERHQHMLGMARMFPLPPGAPPIQLSADDRESRREAAAAVSASLGFYRQGDGFRATKSLDLHDDAPDLLNAGRSSIGSIDRIREFNRRHQRCAECKNDRVVKCPSCRGGADAGRCRVCNDEHFIVCRTCNGHPGPDLTEDELDAMLEFELALLSGRGGSWSSQFKIDRLQPRPVLEPGHLARTLNVDPSMTRYRDGHWQRP